MMLLAPCNNSAVRPFTWIYQVENSYMRQKFVKAATVAAKMPFVIRGESMAKDSGKVHKVMEEFKEGKLKSSSGKKVTTRKQAIAIGLSEARSAGEKTPPEK
jgi:hypothetical protein